MSWNINPRMIVVICVVKSNLCPKTVYKLDSGKFYPILNVVTKTPAVFDE